MKILHLLKEHETNLTVNNEMLLEYKLRFYLGVPRLVTYTYYIIGVS